MPQLSSEVVRMSRDIPSQPEVSPDDYIGHASRRPDGFVVCLVVGVDEPHSVV